MAETTAGRLEALRIDRTRHAERRWGRRLIPLALLVLAALVVAIAIVRRPPEVAVTQVRQARPGEQATRLSAAGYVAAKRRSILAPKIPGRLEKVLVEEGQAVREGQVVARLDQADAKVAVQQAEAQLRNAIARIGAARANLVKTQNDARRAQALYRGNAISRADLQTAQSARDAAAAELKAAIAQRGVAEEMARAARLNLEHTVIRAPFAGTVARKLADEGAVLAPAAITQQNVGGIIELVDLNTLDVEAEVSEDQLRNVRTGQPALIFLDAFPDHVFRAVTGTVRPAVDRSKATATVKVEFRDPPQGVLPDMAAKIAFLSQDVPPEQLANAQGRLRIPASAVIQRGGQPVVLAVENGRLRAEPVKVGERVGDEVALQAGPAVGAQVVTAPSDRLRPGARVRVKSG